MTHEEYLKYMMKGGCQHCLEISKNEIGEAIAFCEEWDCWRNISLGDCMGNCDCQEYTEERNEAE